MYRTIVLALDGSEGSERAVPVAEEYARRDGARIVVAHARTHALETAIEAALHNRVDALSQSGIECSLDVRESLEEDDAKAAAIAAVAHDAEADLIVIASRGRGPFAGALLGSTTQRLLPIAVCPVVVVPGGYTSPGLETAESSVIEA
jgi:nucleotide-binding universal stress UspA family protein